MALHDQETRIIVRPSARAARSSIAIIRWLTPLGLLLLIAGGCGKKAAPIPPGPPPPPEVIPATTIQLKIEPMIIEAGMSATLSWESSNATSVLIDGGVGSVGLKGTRSVSPAATTVYTAKASGRGGDAAAEVRLEVTAARPMVDAPVSDESLGVGTLESLFNQNMRDIYFEYDRYQLAAEAVEILYSNAKFLRDNPRISVVIEGHTDERGSAEYNLALGDRRARVTKDFLTGIGIESGRMTTVSYGEERPFDAGRGEESFARNRRVHFAMARP